MSGAEVVVSPVEADDPVPALLGVIATGLALRADPERARAQQSYMKSAMPFLGIALPDVRGLVHRALQAGPRLTQHDWRRLIIALWDGAEHRELRYAALAVARHRHYRTVANRVANLDLYERLIRSGAWWDLVDDTAHLVSEVLATHRDEVTPILQGWARDADRWVRRVAIISQLDHRELTDTDLLYDCIEPNLADEDFFIRKAIGWALRQYARTDPAWVRSVVVLLDDRLSPLSRREACKHLR